MTRHLPDLSHGLPVFPLPGMTLFPGNLLPLHIFESRYRNLMEDTLKHPAPGRFFAMGTQLNAAREDSFGDPPVFPVAGVGELVEYARLADGRFTLLLRGIGRVKLKGERPLRNGYRVFDAAWLPDAAPAVAPDFERKLALELKALTIHLVGEQGERLRDVLKHEIPLGPLTDLVAGALDFPAEFKLAQIASNNVVERAAAVIAFLEKLMTARGKPLNLDGEAATN
jgi:uncharacterized protein